MPWHRRSYLKEYARDHCVQDLLRFTAAAVDGACSRGTRRPPSFARTCIIPGGVELGVYPAAFWFESIGAVERVVRACIARYATVRDGYQARLWSFCAERLGSWLLLKRLRREVHATLAHGVEWSSRRRWTARFAGQLNLVVDDERSHAGYAGG